MKLERFFSNSFLVALILCISSINVNAQFTAQGNGEWTNSATWGGSAPPATITGFTTISIPAAFTVTMDTNITVAASASLTVNGSLSDNANTHELEIESAGSLSGAGSIEVNEFTFNGGSVISFIGDLEADTVNSVGASITLSADITANSALNVSSGLIDLGGSGSLQLSADATVTIHSVSPSQVISNGNMICDSVYNLIYSGTAVQMGAEAGCAGLADLTIDMDNGNAQVILAGDVTVNGTLSLDQGQLAVGANELTINGDLASGGSGSINGSVASDVTVNASASLSGELTFASGSEMVHDLTINMNDSTAEVTMGSDVAVYGELDMQSGALVLSGNDLTIEGSGDIASGGSGSISSDSNSSIFIEAGAALSGELTLTAGSEDVDTLSVDVGSNNEVTMGSDVNIHGTLDLESGALVLATNDLTIEAGGDIESGGNGSVSSDSMSSIFIEAGATLSGELTFTAGSEDVDTLSIDVGSSNEVTLGSEVEVHGVLDLESGALVLAANDLTISGDVDTSGAGSISADDGADISITAAGSLTGGLVFTAGEDTVNNFTVDIAGGGEVAIESNLTIAGQLNFVSGSVTIDDSLNIASGASITGADGSSFVITNGEGQLTMEIASGGSAEFPVGITASFSPVTIDHNGVNAGNYSVNVGDSVLTEGEFGVDIAETTSVVDRTWHIFASAQTDINIDIEVAWSADMEVNGFDNQNAFISHYEGDWDVEAAAQATLNGAGMFTIGRDSIESLSPFAVYDENTEYCVRPTGVTKTFSANTITMGWDEAANKSQLQYRVKPGQSGAVADQGTMIVTDASMKSFPIAPANCGLVYMARVRHLCSADNTKRSQWKLVPVINTSCPDRIGEFDEEMRLYPNPTEDYLNLSFSMKKDANVTIDIYDMTGRMVISEQVDVYEGQNGFSMDVQSLTSGVYSITIRGDNDTIGTKRFVKSN